MILAACWMFVVVRMAGHFGLLSSLMAITLVCAFTRPLPESWSRVCRPVPG